MQRSSLFRYFNAVSGLLAMLRHAVSSKVQGTVKVRKFKRSSKLKFNPNPSLQPRGGNRQGSSAAESAQIRELQEQLARQKVRPAPCADWKSGYHMLVDFGRPSAGSVLTSAVAG